MLDPLPGRTGIEKRLTELLSVAASGPADRWSHFIYTNARHAEPTVLYVREGINERQVLLDVNAFRDVRPARLVVSQRNGKFVAYGTSLSG